MPRKMDFETQYRAGDARPFDQKNEMFKRIWWDKKFDGALSRFFASTHADAKNGATNETLALANAAWSIERRYALGICGGGNISCLIGTMTT